MHILFLSRWFPFPPDNGSKIRVYQMLRGLSQRHDVTLLSFTESPHSSAENLQRNGICSSIQVVPWKPYNNQSTRARLGFFSSVPRSLVDTYCSEMDARIHTTLQKSKFDLVIASQLTMASYFPSFQTVPAIFEEMELGSFYEAILRETSMSKHFRARLTWLKLQKYVSKLLRNFNAGTVASARELNIIEQHLPAHRHKIEVLPNGLDLQDYQNIKVSRRPNHIIFSGSFSYIANYEAMQWFISRVFPLIIKKIPEVQLIITGDHANLPLPSMENVVLAGYVEDIKSLLASCDVSIAPIWSGGGTRLKILEAMALGTPVIATSKGAEGLMAQDGTHLLIADDPEKFAGYVIRLIQDEALRRKLASNAAQLVKDHYDWQTLMPQFLRLVEKTASG